MKHGDNHNASLEKWYNLGRESALKACYKKDEAQDALGHSEVDGVFLCKFVFILLLVLGGMAYVISSTNPFGALAVVVYGCLLFTAIRQTLSATDMVAQRQGHLYLAAMAVLARRDKLTSSSATTGGTV